MKPSDIMSLSPIVPVIALENPDHALPLAEALLEGGIAVMEITLRTSAALESITRIASEFAQMNVGAGTVINAQGFADAMNAGGSFAFSPGISAEILDYSIEYGYPLIPGVATASDIMMALNRGFDHCKLFPATVAGGIEALKAFSGPFASVRFCPTGGVNGDNFIDFLSLNNVACVGGSWIVPQNLIREQRFTQIKHLCQEAYHRMEEHGLQ